MAGRNCILGRCDRYCVLDMGMKYLLDVKKGQGDAE